MPIAAAAVFLVSLLLIAALFVLKYWEAKHDRVVAPAFRDRADERAQQAKDALQRVNGTLAKLPPIAVYISRIIIHDAALAFAAVASFAEAQAHRLADFVSHKHRFERRETQSDFLKQVSNHKNEVSVGVVE